MEIVLASNNEHKLFEFRKIFSEFNIKVYSLKDLNIEVDPEETGKTFKDNALIKAQEIAKFTDKVIISDDSGLEIEALDGFPGIMSARFLEPKSYEEKFVAINKMLEGKENRNARFNCTLCLYNFKKEPIFFEGLSHGHILHSSNGQNGFGYDPIFFSDDLKKSFALATPEEKNSVSHRGRAIEKLIKYLKEERAI